MQNFHYQCLFNVQYVVKNLSFTYDFKAVYEEVYNAEHLMMIYSSTPLVFPDACNHKINWP